MFLDSMDRKKNDAALQMLQNTCKLGKHLLKKMRLDECFFADANRGAFVKLELSKNRVGLDSRCKKF